MPALLHVHDCTLYPGMESEQKKGMAKGRQEDKKREKRWKGRRATELNNEGNYDGMTMVMMMRRRKLKRCPELRRTTKMMTRRGDRKRRRKKRKRQAGKNN